MQRKHIGIQALLLRTFLPAVLIVAMALAVLVYNLQYAIILDGFDRKLITASALTGAMIDPVDHDWLMDQALGDEDYATLESKDQYIRNVEPMQRIRMKLGLTYLYTQALGGSEDIFYILDSSLGDEHSTIGSEDDLPQETVDGLRSAEANGDVYISPIEYQKQWGLLKTAAAPVYGADGAVTSTAGADVNISVIQIATQNALFASAMIGMVSILACLFVTFQIVRRVARPIEALRQEALRIAAGDHSQPAQIARPREAAALRDALASVVSRIVEMSTDRDVTVATRRRRANEQYLVSSFGEEQFSVTLYDKEDKKIIWIPTVYENTARILALRSMTLLADRLDKHAELASEWKNLADLEHGVCICLDRERHTLGAYGGTIDLRIGEEKAALSDGEEIAIDNAFDVLFRIDTEEIEIRMSTMA